MQELSQLLLEARGNPGGLQEEHPTFHTVCLLLKINKEGRAHFSPQLVYQVALLTVQL